MTVQPLTPEREEDVAESVRELVVRLRAEGFDTFDSGDGSSEFPYGNPFPHVFIAVEPSRLVAETERAKEWLASVGVHFGPQNEHGTAPEICGSYSPTAMPPEQRGTITIINVTSAMLNGGAEGHPTPSKEGA